MSNYNSSCKIVSKMANPKERYITEKITMCHLSICTTLTTFCAYVFVCARESYFRLLIERN